MLFRLWRSYLILSVILSLINYICNYTNLNFELLNIIPILNFYKFTSRIDTILDLVLLIVLFIILDYFVRVILHKWSFIFEDKFKDF